MQRRRRTHPVYLAMAVVLLVLVVTSGCAVPGYNERDAMLFEDKIHTEFKTGGFTPNSEHFSGGSGFGLKVNYEYEYGMHFGFEFDTIDNVEGQPFARTASETGVDYFANHDNIRSVGARAIESQNRREFLVGLDWDVPLSKEGNLPFLRYGIGIGGLMAQAHTSDAFLAEVALDNTGTTSGVPTVAVADQFIMLVRPSASMRWEMWDGAIALLAEAQYDIASSEVRIDIDTDGDSAGDLDYGGLNAFVGIDFSF
ncbi:MAG: hypothetical protein OSB12_08155 [Planctomycetota bacterium]|nr:hypothetical protein [Planctomycetota bacterium]